MPRPRAGRRLSAGFTRHLGPGAARHFLGQREVALAALRADVVEQDRLAVAGRLGEPHVAGDDGLEDLVVEGPPDLVGHLVGQVVGRVHGEDDPVHLEVGVGRGLDELDGLQDVGEPLQRVVLALERDHHALGGDQAVEREEAERGRAVDDDELVVRRPAARAPRAGAAPGPRAATSSSSAPTRCCEAGTRSRYLSSVLRTASAQREAVERAPRRCSAPTRRGGCRGPSRRSPAGRRR